MPDEKNAFFDAYYSNYFNQLKLYAYSILGNWGRAEEATQDVFHTAWRKIDIFMASPNPVGWLVQTMKYTTRNLQREDALRAKLFISITDPDSLPDASPPGADIDMIDLEDACASLLTAEEYHILCRWVLDKATYQEIADELDITLWACQKRMQRLMKKLRDRLKK